MTADNTAVLAPVRSGDRIVSLDTLRGVAVLGILAVNAAAFALPFMLQMAPDQTPFPLTGDNAVTAAAIAKRAYQEGRPVLDVALEDSGLAEAELKRLLDPARLTRGGLAD